MNGRGEAYIAGYTYSNDYPVLNALQSRKSNGADAFISRLSADGRNLLSSTFIGGDYLDGIHGLALDSSGFVYVTGVTGSDDFPIKNPLQPALGAPAGFTSNAFVAKLTPTMDAFVYSTYLGGSGYANGWSIAIDSSGSAAICGVAAVGFPTRNASQPLYGGGLVDIFVAKLTADGSSLVFSTYLGGGDADYQSASTLALDADGNIYTTGFTYSNDFPLKQSLQSFIGATGGYRTDAFVAKFSPMGTLLYSTLIGGHGDDRGTSIAVDSNRTVYVTGVTYSDDFPLVNPFQKTYGGAGDVFVIKLAPDIAPTSPFSPTPGTAQFTFIVGGPTPTPQRISIPTGGAFTIAASSAAWLSVSPQAGMAPSVLSIQANPIGLAPQLYSASIQIVPTSGSSFELPVILNVLAAAPVVTSISPSNVPLNSAGTSFTISGSGFTAASRVKINSVSELPTTFIDSSTLQFSLGKDVFTQAGSYLINVVGLQSAPSTSVSLTVGTPPPFITAVTNAASYGTGGVAPGEIMSVFGTGLGPSVGVPLSLTSTGLVSTTLGGTQVLFDGIPAPLIYVRADQVSAIVPYAIGDGRANTRVVVQYNGQASAVFTVPVAGSAPALFTADARGRGQGAILNEDGSVNSLSNPAAKGSVVVLYGTGEGATNPPGVDGKLATDVLPKPTLSVAVSVDGKDAQVLYAGAAPGEVAGVIQVNVRLPNGVNSGPVPVVLQVGGASSQSGIVLSVQ